MGKKKSQRLEGEEEELEPSVESDDSEMQRKMDEFDS